MDASEQIDKYIAEHADWRGKLVSNLRELIRKADPEIAEEWKWSSPVWSHNGPVVSVSAFKDHVAMNFFHGASLGDPHQLFNSGLDAKLSRSISFQKGDKIDEAATEELVRAAITHNTSDL